MEIEAWLMDDSGEDQRLPHKRDPPEYVSLAYLADLGVLYWHLNPKDYENDQELKEIRENRGYSYMDLLDLCPEKVENYDQKVKNFYTEHIHGDEEIRYCLEGSGYFDVRDRNDRWIRMWIKAGDLIVLPPVHPRHQQLCEADEAVRGRASVDSIQQATGGSSSQERICENFCRGGGGATGSSLRQNLIPS